MKGIIKHYHHVLEPLLIDARPQGCNTLMRSWQASIDMKVSLFTLVSAAVTRGEGARASFTKRPIRQHMPDLESNIQLSEHI